ncbi:MAG: WGR domain-containing protein [Kofleriaceae bacterium]|nr:WGR domain-containing protein [Kofleriaceae bacterium]
MAARTVYFTDPAVQPLAKAVCDALAAQHKLKTKAVALPAAVDAKLLANGVVIKVRPGGTFAPKAKQISVEVDLVVPGGILTEKLAYADSVRRYGLNGEQLDLTPYEALAHGLAYVLAPFVDAPAKRTIAMYTRKSDKEQVDALMHMFRTAGLEPLAPKPAVVDGEGMFEVEAKKWRKTAWARLELDFVHSNEAKVCARGETSSGVTIGSLNNTYNKAYKVKNPSGEDPMKTRQRLHDLLDREMLPCLGVVPVKQRRDEAAIIAFLGGAPAPAAKPAKPAATPTKAAAPAKATKATKAAAGTRRFEFQGGGSSKFWTVSTKGSTLSVTFGRIGTAGQTKDKSYASNAAASAAMEKLVEEKTAKGYVEAS